MRRRSHEFDTEEAFDAARQLKPLVRETRGVLGSLATQGLRKLNSLSPDRHYPVTLPEDTHGDPRFFKGRQILRTVSPKINANLNIDGFPNLAVVSADSTYYQRRHPFGRIQSLRNPAKSASVPLPSSRSDEWLGLYIRDVTDNRPDHQKALFRASMSTAGDVAADFCYVSRPHPPFGSDHPCQYQSPEQVRRIYGDVFTESLALGGLVAHGMRALDIDLNPAPAKALFNDWRGVLGQEPVTVDAFWVESNSNYLIGQRPGDGQG